MSDRNGLLDSLPYVKTRYTVRPEVNLIRRGVQFERIARPRSAMQ
jgi:hypothetical protein